MAKKSFFERLTGAIHMDDDFIDPRDEMAKNPNINNNANPNALHNQHKNLYNNQSAYSKNPLYGQNNISLDQYETKSQPLSVRHAGIKRKPSSNYNDDGYSEEEQDSYSDEGEPEGQLAVDVFQNETEIIIKTMVAGVKPENLEVNISRDTVSIKGSREQIIDEDFDFFHQELYWGAFSRTIMLPEEIDIEGAEAIEKYGMLTLHLPKLDKNRQQNSELKVRVKTEKI